MSVILILMSILMIVCGVDCIATPVATFSALGWLAGGSIVVVGVSAIFRFAAGREGRSVWELIGGIAGVLFGGFIVVNAFAQFATNLVIAVTAAVWMAVYGVCGISEALALRKLNQALPGELRTAGWLVVLILGAATAVIGIVCVFQPWITMISVGLLIGVSILISGIKTLILSIQIIKSR